MAECREVLDEHDIHQGTGADYWEKRFREGKLLWGTEPSPVVFRAIELFHENEVKTILVPGAGYGRNARHLARNGFHVDAVELSREAILIGNDFASGVQYVEASALDRDCRRADAYEAVFCYDLIHLFLEEERSKLIENLVYWTKPGGIVMVSSFSVEDDTCGQGRVIEPGTYEVKPGKVVHFATNAEMEALHPLLECLERNTSIEVIQTETRHETYRLVYAFYRVLKKEQMDEQETYGNENLVRPARKAGPAHSRGCAPPSD